MTPSYTTVSTCDSSLQSRAFVLTYEHLNQSVVLFVLGILGYILKITSGRGTIFRGALRCLQHIFTLGCMCRQRIRRLFTQFEGNLRIQENQKIRDEGSLCVCGCYRVSSGDTHDTELMQGKNITRPRECELRVCR